MATSKNARKENVLKYRVTSKRGDVKMDHKVNHPMRCFFMKTEEMIELDRKPVDPTDLMGTLNASLVILVKLMLPIGRQMVSNISQKTGAPAELKRFVIYYNEDDDFYSVIFGLYFKYDENYSSISELRFICGKAATVVDSKFFFLNTYMLDVATGEWDGAHCQDSLVRDWDETKCKRLFFGIEPPKIINKGSVRGRARKQTLGITGSQAAEIFQSNLNTTNLLGQVSELSEDEDSEDETLVDEQETENQNKILDDGEAF